MNSTEHSATGDEPLKLLGYTNYYTSHTIALYWKLIICYRESLLLDDFPADINVEEEENNGRFIGVYNGVQFKS